MSKPAAGPHEAHGVVRLTGIHFVVGKSASLDNIVSFRWRDTSSDVHGQSAQDRLALFIERGGRIVVEADGELLEVAVSSTRHPFTAGRTPSTDPILALPQYHGHP